MKRCQKCNINVGGRHECCPLCQNRLFGDASEPYFPEVDDLRSKVIFYKIQLFTCIAIMFISLVLDCLIGLNNGIHWSYIVVSWLLVGQVVVRLLLRKHSGIIFFFVDISIALIILITATGYYLGIGEFCLSYIIPAIIMGTIASEFAFCLADKNDLVMPYLLGGILLGGIIYIVVRQLNGINMLLWNISLLLSLLALIGIVIFRGRAVHSELEKRLHI